MKSRKGLISVKQAYLKILSVILVLAIIGLSVVGNYGITWDEPIEVDMVNHNLEYIRENKPISEMSRHYGFYFNYISQLIYETKENFFPATPNLPPNPTDKDKWLSRIWQITRVKHVVTFLFSLIAYLSVVGIVAILAGIESAWLGALILALFPAFWGHSFFNPKDIPFAAMFTLGTFAGSVLLDKYFQSENQTIKLGFNRLTVYSCLYGILAGLITGIRIGGFFILFYLIFAHLVARWNLKTILKTLWRFLPLYAVIILFWAITTYIVYPAAWRNPITWFIEAITLMSKYNIWDNTVLFDGQNIPGRSLPWYYLPRLFSLTTPVLLQIAVLLGVMGILTKMTKLTPSQRACAIITLLQAFLLPTFAILRQSTLYDGIRHFLFVIPALAAIASTAIIWTYHKLKRKSIKIFLTTLLILNFSVIVYDMISLHPYEYTYYNRAYGGLKATQGQQETDYWGLSLKEGMEWLNQNAAANSTIVVAGPMFAAEMVQDYQKNLTMIYRDDFAWGKAPEPDYYMGLSRYDYFQAFPHCPIVHAVQRQDTPLTIIKRCPQL
ncbi:Similar to tr/Q89QQ8/Q89QQ8 [Microcystis aeruginosa PCC 9432]|uniref:Similar to tr/Q89QQ8/Q89QQ8 n=1 Tax=Microcystis aeruginosa PCC 9432 TaxID=1160280 RepID=A0A822LD56_MICAE|nr:hypothetical protein [Microcystis aeruginosa]TRU00663.1 MAG: hypothetical protein EWV62_03625 [Microcystis aeruginosa Ma_OC_LR_19540900_S633]CCH93172.1 Similar to tr/Q89QQ8/Q89QQ8 [Microcystis aeruginosa PCC 9432]